MKKLSLLTVVLFLFVAMPIFAGNFSATLLYPNDVTVQQNQPQFFGWKIDNAAALVGGTFKLLIGDEIAMEGNLQPKAHQRFAVPMKLQSGQYEWTVKMLFNDGTHQTLTGFNFIVATVLAKKQSADLELKKFFSNFQTGKFTGIALLSGDISAFDFGNIRGFSNGQWIDLGTGACYIPGEYLRKEKQAWIFKATLPDRRLSPENFEFILVVGTAYDKAGNEVTQEIRSYPLGVIPPRSISTVAVSNYPNPFNPITTITYHLDQATDVQLTVYNMTGQQVATLVNKYQTSGKYAVKFDASNLASGTYFYRLKVGQKILIKRMFLLK